MRRGDINVLGGLLKRYRCGLAYLLHVSQYVLPAVKHPPAFFRVQLVDEVCCVVFITVLVSKQAQHQTGSLVTRNSNFINFIQTASGFLGDERVCNTDARCQDSCF